MKQSLHERIRSEFEGRILAGELSPGDRLPTEQELMEQYACSRMTVNKALSALSAAGLIDRRKKAGTTVARPRMHSMVLDVPDLPTQIRERGQDYKYQQTARAISRPMDCPEYSELKRWLGGHEAMMLQVDGVHFADAVPIAYEHRFINIDAVMEIASASFDDEPPGSWLLKYIPWTEAETRISALGVSVDIAPFLSLEIGSPCLSVERRTWQAGEAITWVQQIFVANAYDLTARFGSAG